MSTVLFYVLFVCKCVLYYCHRVATQLQLNILYHIYIPVFILSPLGLRRPGHPGHSLSSSYVTLRKSTKCVEQPNWWSELMWSKIARPTGVFIRSIWHRCVSNLSLIKEIIPTTISDDANLEAATSLFQDEKSAKSMEITVAGSTLPGSCSSRQIKIEVTTDLSGPGSAVGIATGYGLDGPGIESRWGGDFPHLSRPVLGSTQPPVQWVPGLSWA